MGRKKVRILTLILIIVAIIAMALGALLYVTNQRLVKSAMDADSVKTELENNRQTNVWVAKTDIKKGDSIIDSKTAEEKNSNDPSQSRDEQTASAIIQTEVIANIYKDDIYTSLPRSSYITSEQIGATALVDIPAGTPIMANMVEALTITTDTREFEITAVNLMVDQQENDIVDIRLAFPNGEDYLVLPKKQIKNLSLAYADFWTYMTENEILTYRSAVCDAYQTTGAYFYAVRYVESNLQDGATANYLVRSETIDLMRSDPNLYATAEQTMNASARLALEVRLGQLTDDQLAAVANGLGIADTAKNSVLAQNTDNNAAAIGSYGLDKHTREEELNSDSEETTEDTTGDATTSNGLVSPDTFNSTELSTPVDIDGGT